MLEKKDKDLEKNEKELEDLLVDLDNDIVEIENLRQKIKKENISFISPQKNKKLLEELEIPSLEMLKESNEKKK